MKDFFFNLLNNLDKLAGLKQLDKIYAVHGEDEQGAKNEIKALLKVLCNVSEQFPFIPEHEQQKIITHAVVSEEFNSLNANTVYKWLARHKDKYFKEIHHVEGAQPETPPLTGEARQAKLKEWMNSLAGLEQMMIAKASDQELNAEKRRTEGTMEWLRDRPKEVTAYKPPTEEEVNAHKLHIEYIRENYDPYTGKPKPTWIEESQWNKSRK